MKRVRFVEDIVRRNAVAKRSGGKTALGNIKNATKAISKLPGARISSVIGLAIIFAEAFFFMKTAKNFFPGQQIARLSGAAANPEAPASFPQGAMIQNLIATIHSASSATSSYVLQLPDVKPGLLPAVKPPSFKTASTLAAASSEKTSSAASRPRPASAPAAMTARSFLDATTLSANERYDGPYALSFTTNAGTYGKITWDLSESVIAASGSLPKFSVSYSCDPPPDMPPPDALDKNPTFGVKSHYDCTVTLAPTSGGDLSAQPKEFSFTTGAGQIVIAPPPSMDTVLKDGPNFGGFVFRNDDADPVTVTGLDIDVSYKGINVTDSPLVLRFKDAASELTLYDYHLEGLAANSSVTDTHVGTNINIPLSFTIKGGDRKMLAVNLLAVQKLGIYGLDPTVSVSLRNVSVNNSINGAKLNLAKISWSCIIPLGAYDPSATVDPYGGRACRQ